MFGGGADFLHLMILSAREWDSDRRAWMSAVVSDRLSTVCVRVRVCVCGIFTHSCCSWR